MIRKLCQLRVSQMSHTRILPLHSLTGQPRPDIDTTRHGTARHLTLLTPSCGQAFPHEDSASFLIWIFRSRLILLGLHFSSHFLFPTHLSPSAQLLSFLGFIGLEVFHQVELTRDMTGQGILGVPASKLTVFFFSFYSRPAL